MASVCSEITDLIEVSHPYFSLKNLSVVGDAVQADVPVEHPMGNERGVIAAAEVGRHLAILGSCALAHVNNIKKKHFYLASDAMIRNLHDGVIENASLPLKAEARTISLEKRKGSAVATITDTKGIPLYELQTNYHIMKPNLFEKLYQSRRYTESACVTAKNPYLSEFSFSNVSYNDDCMSAVLGPLGPEQCSGHFLNYPCIPVAILMHALSNAAGMLLAHTQNRPKSPYRVLSADVIADQFAFAGEEVFIDVVQEDQSASNSFVFRCSAMNGDSTRFGYMDLRLGVG